MSGFIVLLLMVLIATLMAMDWSRGEDKPEIRMVVFSNPQIKGRIMALTLAPGQFIDIELRPVDRRGKPALIEEGSATFSSSDDSVFTVEQDAENELKARITSVAVGTAQLDFSLDADLDDDEVRTLADFTAVEVKAEEAVGLAFVASEAQDIPEED